MIILPLYYAYLILLAFCSVMGIFCTWGLKRTLLHIKLLPWFLVLTLISEVLAYQFAVNFGSNHNLYNIYELFQFVFYSYLLYRTIKSYRIRSLLIFISIAYVVFAILNISIIQGIKQYNTINFFIGCIILSFFSSYSLNELFKNANAGNPFKTSFFWISSSILVLSSCLIPLILPATFGLQLTRSEARVIHCLIMTVNYIAYSMFIVAFWYQYKNKARSSLQR